MRATDLNHLRYLVEVADSGSFSAAARVFGVPPSLVSRRIARLEAELGARLFQRTTRSIRLTDAGQAFLEHARAGLDSFALAHDVIDDLQGIVGGRVRVSAPLGLADVLWSVVSRFLVLNPAVQVELALSDNYVDLIEGRFDLALRAGPETHSDKLIGRRLSSAPRWLFASPAYLEAHGTPVVVEDLKHHSAVILGPRSDRVTWELQVGKQRRSVIVDGRVAVNQARIAADCTADGFGIGFLPLAVCDRHVAAGRLQRVLPMASGGDLGFWLVYPDRHLPAASRALADYLTTELPASMPNQVSMLAAAR